MTALETKVVTIIAMRMGIATGRIQLASRLVADLGADSLDMVDVMMDLEREFRISIADAEVERIVTVADVVQLLQAKTRVMGAC